MRAAKTEFVVLDKYTVREIHPKYIVLTHKDERHLVFQNKFASEFREPARPSTPAASGLSFAEEGFERRENKIQMTSMYRDRMLQEQLPNILMQATAVPHMIDGQIHGFRVFQIDDDSIYQKAVLQDHDIITHINGQALNNAGAAIQLLQSLRNASHIVVEIERQSQPMQLELTVD